MNKSDKEQATYSVCIEEIISQEFEIKADSYEEALEKARAGYRGGKLVLDAAEVLQVQMCVMPTVVGDDEEIPYMWEEL